MSETSASGATPASRPSPAGGKVPRQRLVRLRVEADLCPQVLMRVLGLLSRQWLLPLTIAYRRADDVILIEIEIDRADLPGLQAETLLRNVQAIVMVREAELVDG